MHLSACLSVSPLEIRPGFQDSQLPFDSVHDLWRPPGRVGPLPSSISSFSLGRSCHEADRNCRCWCVSPGLWFRLLLPGPLVWHALRGRLRWWMPAVRWRGVWGWLSSQPVRSGWLRRGLCSERHGSECLLPGCSDASERALSVPDDGIEPDADLVRGVAFWRGRGDAPRDMGGMFGCSNVRDSPAFRFLRERPFGRLKADPWDDRDVSRSCRVE